MSEPTATTPTKRSSAAAATTSSPARTQAVRVEELGDTGTDPGAVPRELARYFEGRGLRLSLRSVYPTQVARYAKTQAYQLTESDIPASDRDKVLALIAGAGFRHRDGIYMLGDTCLYKQSLAQWERLGMEAYRSWDRQRPNSNRDAAAILDNVDGNIRHGVVVEPMDRVPSSSPYFESLENR